MRTPTTIEALEMAIQMLELGQAWFTPGEWRARMEAVRAAAEAHREQEVKDEQRRADFRQLAAKWRAA